MARAVALALVALFAMVTTVARADEAVNCSYTEGNNTFSLNWLVADPQTPFVTDIKTYGEKAQIYLSPCASMTFTPNASAPNATCSGFVAIATGEECRFQFANMSGPVTMQGNDTLVATYETKDGSDQLTIAVTCDATLSATQIDMADYDKADEKFTLKLKSPTVCANYQQAAPADKTSLSTGAIIGIVVGAVALVAIVIGVCVFKSKSSGDEGGYSRV